MTKKLVNPTPVIDFKVNAATGIGYISQRKTAELCGVHLNAIQARAKKLRDQRSGNNTPVIKQLSDQQLTEMVCYYAIEKHNHTAVRTLGAFAQAGARSFIYSQAGYNPQQLPAVSSKLHECCIPVRWLAQQIGRSRSSVDRTLNVSLARLRSFGIHAEVEFVNGERCVSPAVVICSAFTGRDMQKMRAWLLDLAEVAKLPPADVLISLTHTWGVK